MRKKKFDGDVYIGEGKRLIVKVTKVIKDENFPEGIEFSLQYIYHKNNEWHQIVRIDNLFHEGRPGTHIHILKRKKVEWINLSFSEAKKRIIELGDNIIKNIIERL
ncbi:hypothetical protein ACFL0W_02840 [Nanoarchaeota archaeon]